MVSAKIKPTQTHISHSDVAKCQTWFNPNPPTTLKVPTLTGGCQVWIVKEWVSGLKFRDKMRTSDIQKELKDDEMTEPLEASWTPLCGGTVFCPFGRIPQDRPRDYIFHLVWEHLSMGTKNSK